MVRVVEGETADGSYATIALSEKSSLFSKIKHVRRVEIENGAFRSSVSSSFSVMIGDHSHPPDAISESLKETFSIFRNHLTTSPHVLAEHPEAMQSSIGG